LRDRLEHKAFANAKLYLDMGLMDDYRAAVIAFDNALRDYPDTKYAEEMEYLSIKAQYLYAYNSTIRRQEERYAEVIDLYDRFVTSYPDSKFKKEADDYRKNAERGMKEAKQKMDSFTLPEVLAAASDSVKQEIKNSQNKN
jgi:outer membrane protein assembly factor BamD